MEEEWKALEKDCNNCRSCDLYKNRSNVVIGRGSKKAKIMLIGEGPGEQEDLQGLAFVGPAGKLLDLLLEAMMFNGEDYYIANIVKCRPPGNRVPFDEEAYKCLPYLRRQVKLIKPRILVCLGATATKYIINKDAKISQIRGTWIESKGFWMMPTYHPAAVLRDEAKKIQIWQDFKKIRRRYEEICLK